MPADVKGVIEELLEQHERQLQELRSLRTTILGLAARYKVDVELPNLDEDSPKTTTSESRKIRPGALFGLSQTDAVAKYFELVKEPKTMEEILEGLEAGGCVVGGKDPRATIYTQIIRATHRFVKLPSGHFGLLEWFPNEKAKRSTPRKPKGGMVELAEDVEVEATKTRSSGKTAKPKQTKPSTAKGSAKSTPEKKATSEKKKATSEKKAQPELQADGVAEHP